LVGNYLKPDFRVFCNDAGGMRIGEIVHDGIAYIVPVCISKMKTLVISVFIFEMHTGTIYVNLETRACNPLRRLAGSGYEIGTIYAILA
jgi:hypothetical protein